MFVYLGVYACLCLCLCFCMFVCLGVREFVCVCPTDNSVAKKKKITCRRRQPMIACNEKVHWGLETTRYARTRSLAIQEKQLLSSPQAQIWIGL